MWHCSKRVDKPPGFPAMLDLPVGHPAKVAANPRGLNNSSGCRSWLLRGGSIVVLPECLHSRPELWCSKRAKMWSVFSGAPYRSHRP
jgi:hypothetical protein